MMWFDPDRYWQITLPGRAIATHTLTEALSLCGFNVTALCSGLQLFRVSVMVTFWAQHQTSNRPVIYQIA